jgi:sulfatase modifying factor 1
MINLRMKAGKSLLVVTLLFNLISTARSVTFDWATVGDAGNVDDPETGLGSVDYIYRISKHEVTNAQYVEFLNAVAATDTFNLYKPSMEIIPQAGIIRSGVPGSYIYSVKPDVVGGIGSGYTYGNKPVVLVSFFDAMRFVNWLDNGQPTGTQGPATTEDGVYTIGDGINEVRNPNAKFFIPNEDEWYKAAYYDPQGIYYDYPMMSNSLPNNNHPAGDTGNSANFLNSFINYPLTDVGAYPLSKSPYGTSDQGGNVSEWTETTYVSVYRKNRGGKWSFTSDLLKASYFETDGPSQYKDIIGFRVASIPEPTAISMALLAASTLLARKSSIRYFLG